MASWREMYPLEKIKPLKKTFGPAFGWLIVFAIFIFTFSATGFVNGVFISIALYILIVLASYVFQYYYFKSYFYNATKDTLVIKKGVFTKNEINLPFKRIQDVYVDQDILDRIFGLYDVNVSSATAISAYLSHIDGLNKENSEKVKKLIMKAVHKK